MEEENIEPLRAALNEDCGLTEEDFIPKVHIDVPMPLDYGGEELAEELERLTDEMLERIPHPDKYMDVKVGGSDIRLCYQNILYAEHFAHVIQIHTTAGKTLATRQPFKTFVEPLKDDRRFFVCGRGVIVNLENAADFRDAAFCMTDGSRVYVIQELLKPARQAFMEFLLQRERMK